MQYIFDATGKFLRAYSNSNFPDGMPGMTKVGEMEHIENDPVKIETYAKSGSIEFDSVKKTIIMWPKLSVSVDKTQIKADGIDTAIVTATLVDATAAEETINFDVAGTVYPVQTVNKTATLPIKTTVAKDILAIAKSTTKYGENSLIIKGV